MRTYLREHRGNTASGGRHHSPGIRTLLLALLVSLNVAPARAAPPKGFEDLDRGQLEYRDVIFMGKSLGITPVWITPSTLKFLKAPAIRAKLPLSSQLAADRKADLNDQLAGALVRHGEQVCRAHSLPSCGFVDADPVAIIDNAANQQVALFIHPGLLAGRENGRTPRYHQVSPAQRAWIQQQHLNISSSRDYRNLAADASWALGVKDDSWLQGQWHYLNTQQRNTSYQRLIADSVYYRHELNPRLYLQGGRMDMGTLASREGGGFNFAFLSANAMDGIRFGSSLSRLDESTAQPGDSPITVLLPRPARVDIWRGRQLVGSQYFDAGVQALETQGFPAGSYTVTLKIFENGRYARSENVPYSGGGADAPGQSQYFVQMGRRVAIDAYHPGRNDGSGRQSLLAGLRVPLNRSSTLSLGGESAGRRPATETRLDWGAPTPMGVISGYAALLMRAGKVSSHTEQLSWQQGISAVVNHTQRREDDTHARFSSLNGRIMFPLRHWQFTFGYNQADSTHRGFMAGEDYDGGLATDRYQGALFRRQLTRTRTGQFTLTRTWRHGSWSFMPQLSLFRSRSMGVTDNGGFITLSVFRNTASPSGKASWFHADMTMTHQPHQTNSGRVAVGQTLSWRDRDYRELRFDALAEGEGKRQVHNVSLGGAWHHQYGNADGTVARYNQQTTFSGSWSSAVAVSASGVNFSGGDVNNTSLSGEVIALELEGSDSSRTVAELKTSNGQQRHLMARHSAFVPLPAWQPVQTDVSGFTERRNGDNWHLPEGGGEQQYFLLPGHVAVRNLVSRLTHTWIGGLMDNQHRPLAGGLLLGAEATPLNPDGSFVAELTGTPRVIYAQYHQRYYRCPLRVRPGNGGLRITGQLVCEPIAAEKLPPSVMKTVPV